MAIMCGPAAAKLDLVVRLPDATTAQADFATGIVEVLREQWAFIDNPMSVEDSVACGPDFACLLKRSTAAGATHLLAIGVAPGDGDVLVSVKVIAISGEVVFEHSGFASLSAMPIDDGNAFARNEINLAHLGLERGLGVGKTTKPTDGDGFPLLTVLGGSVAGLGVVSGVVAIASGVMVQQTRDAIESTSDARIGETKGWVTAQSVSAVVSVGLIATGAAVAGASFMLE